MRLPWFYYIGRWLTKLLLTLFTRYKVNGRENVPPSGALIVIANHLNLADPPILGSVIPRKMLFMAKEELFRSWPSGYFIRTFGSFPVRRGGRDRKALERAQAMLQEGMALAMFPEGTRSKTAQLQPAFPGSALIALRCSAPILPVGIAGTEKLSGRAWFLHRPQVVVNIGHPFALPTTGSNLSKSLLQEATLMMMRNIARLLPPSYRGNYEREADASH
jgi:1-acyl-sn-glycerol-3-phosphate acyltransferase